jgi:hypothetical protein
MISRRHLIIGSLAAFDIVTGTAPIPAETIMGPSSSATPYVINVPSNVDITAILTVGDSVNNKPDGMTRYRMVGIPDGLGAFDNYDGTFTVLMNHEIPIEDPDEDGIVRQHGFAGAFVSHWIIRKSDLTVLHGGDQAKQVLEWSVPDNHFVPAARAIGRLCSADLASPSAFYDRSSGKGYTGRIFMDGEEVGANGRAFAHIVTGPGAGISYELPSLGKFSWENALASPYEQVKTVVIGTDDATPGQVYVYVGEKQTTGNEIEKAGLHGGSLYGVAVLGFDREEADPSSDTRGPGITNGAPFALAKIGDVRGMTGAQIQTASANAMVTEFLRPEDGAWDTRNPNVFYFVTTDRYDSSKDGSGTPEPPVARSRLHRLTFADIKNPEFGGRYDMLLDGTGPYQMLDNMTVDCDGNLIIQEDPGNQTHLARIWKFYPHSRDLVEIAKHDPARFADPPMPPFNSDEESSGIIEITHLLRKNSKSSDSDRFDRHDGHDDDEFDERCKWAKRGYRYYLGGTQAHYSQDDPELVEGGQLFIIGVPRNVRQAPSKRAIEETDSTKPRAGFRR